MALFCNPACHLAGRSASISGTPCATYHMYVSAQSLDFLELAEKCLISDLETASANLFDSGWPLVRVHQQLLRDFGLSGSRKPFTEELKALPSSLLHSIF